MRDWLLFGGATLSIALMSVVPFALFSFLTAGAALTPQLLSFGTGLALMIITAKATEKETR